MKAKKKKGLGTVKRRIPASKKAGNNNMLIALGAAVAGGALFLLKGKGNNSVVDFPEPAVVVGSNTTATKTAIAPKTGTSVQPVPAHPYPSDTVLDNTEKNHVFVDSWNGESVYGKAADSWIKANSDFIVIVLPKRYLGKLTGRQAKDPLNNYVEVGSFIDRKFRTYWVEKSHVKFVTDMERAKMLKGGGYYPIGADQLQAFRRYFINK